MIRGFRFQLHPSGSPSDSRLDPSLITWLRPFLGVAIVATCVVFVGMAQAQHSGDAGSAPPPPPGPGTLSIQIIAGEQAGTIEGLSIALYALAPDGTPGLTDAVTDAEGRVTFSGISNDPSIVYLIGARYAGIPFGERIAFVAGETEARAEIVVSAPTDRVEGVSLDELRTRIDWMGDRVVVTEILRFTSSGTRVIQLSEDDSTQAIARRRLPPGATDFSAGPSSIGDGLGLENGQVRFWGPLYPGDQRVEYRYSLPLRPGDRTLTLPLELHEDASRVVVVAGTNGMEISGPGFLPSQNVAAETVPTLNSWART
jgi:hypothetical protein